MNSNTSRFYITRGGYREVYLHRRNDVTGPFGRYCCDHFNANISRETLCIETGKLFVSDSSCSAQQCNFTNAALVDTHFVSPQGESIV